VRRAVSINLINIPRWQWWRRQCALVWAAKRDYLFNYTALSRHISAVVRLSRLFPTRRELGSEYRARIGGDKIRAFSTTSKTIDARRTDFFPFINAMNREERRRGKVGSRWPPLLGYHRPPPCGKREYGGGSSFVSSALT